MKKVIEGLKTAKGPLERIHAIIEANLSEDTFEPEIVSAWLTFYVQALNTSEAERLMQIYVRRLRSNLLHSLKALQIGNPSQEIAFGIGALIDGVYLRQALDKDAPSRQTSIMLIKSFADSQIKRTMK